MSQVPVFDCQIYVDPDPVAGRVRARVANLAGIEAEGATEREALRLAAAAFKRAVAAYTEAGQSIPWLDPVLERQPHEQPRRLPVHL
jgi:hypothetical protein